MKKITVSAIGAIALTVGLYHLVFLTMPKANIVLVAFTFVFAIAAFTLSASGFAPFPFAALAVGAAFVLSSFAGTVYTFVAVAVASVFIVAAAVAFATDATRGDVRYRWALIAYCIEGFTIACALAIDSTIESIAIALCGMLGLLLLWRVAPAPSPEKSEAHGQLRA